MYTDQAFQRAVDLSNSYQTYRRTV